MGDVDNRRGGRAHNRRDEILRVALETFAERGYRGTSLAVVAERIGLTQQGVLHYFPTKQALLVEVLKLRDAEDYHRFDEGSDEPHLDGMRHLMEYNATRPGVVQSFTVLSAESVTDAHPAREYFVQRYRVSRGHHVSGLREELGERIAGRLTPEQAAALLVAVMDGLQLQWLLDPDQIDLVDLVDGFAALLRDGAPPAVPVVAAAGADA
jgi:AcrR family transcriptional regulator